MAKSDPLSVAAVQFPGSSFDPVKSMGRAADQVLADFRYLEDQYRQGLTPPEVKLPDNWNDKAYGQLLDVANKYRSLGPQLYMKGYNPKDPVNPKNRKAAQLLYGAKDNFNRLSSMYEKQGEFYKNAYQKLNNPNNLDKIDLEATMKNMADFKSRGLRENEKWLQGGNQLVVIKQPKFDIMTDITRGMGDYLKPRVGTDIRIDEETGRIWTTGKEEITEDMVRDFLALKYDESYDEKTKRPYKEAVPEKMQERGIKVSEDPKERRKQAIDWMYDQFGEKWTYKEEDRSVKGGKAGRAGYGADVDKVGDLDKYEDAIPYRDTNILSPFVLPLADISSFEMQVDDDWIAMRGGDAQRMSGSVVASPISFAYIPVSKGQEGKKLGIFKVGRDVPEGEILTSRPGDADLLKKGNIKYKPYVIVRASYGTGPQEGEKGFKNTYAIPYEGQMEEALKQKKKEWSSFSKRLPKIEDLINKKYQPYEPDIAGTTGPETGFDAELEMQKFLNR